MAGLFQVLYGNEDGEFSKATVLNGSDDEPLIIPASQEDMIKKICTRPCAADINDDGNLDLVVGNFGGTFYVFHGEGDGAFNPEPEVMKSGDDKELKVPFHSDPFVVDWDSDGDLDILSGSSLGGVYISLNEGSKSESKFTQFEELIQRAKNSSSEKFGDDHIGGPQGSTRVWVDDLNNDGKLDLLVGDSVRLKFPAEGLDEKDVEEKMEKWQEEYSKFYKDYIKIAEAYQKALAEKQASKDDDSEDSDEQSAEDTDTEKDEEKDEVEELMEQMQEAREKVTEIYDARSDFIREESTGFVWVYYQK